MNFRLFECRYSEDFDEQVGKPYPGFQTVIFDIDTVVSTGNFDLSSADP